MDDNWSQHDHGYESENKEQKSFISKQLRDFHR